MGAKPWSHQASLKREPIPTQNELLTSIDLIPSKRDRALVAIAYLTGGRISELVREENLKKTTYKKGKVYKVDTIKLDYKGITKKNMTIQKIKGDSLLVIDIQNRKNKNRLRKTIPIPIAKEQKFVDVIGEYTITLNANDPLFTFNKHRAYQIMRQHMNMNCHFFRDIRATHLVTLHGLGDFKLVKYMGWSDARPASRYVQLDWKDIWGGK